MSDKGSLSVPPGIARRSSLFEVPAHPRMSITRGSSMMFAAEPLMAESLHLVKKPPVEYENTYQMEPVNKFRADKVNVIIKESLDSHLENKHYDPIACGILAKTISKEIKDKVKALNYKRYKYVVTVDIGEKKDQGVRVGSRFVWDTAWDNYSTANFENQHIFAVGLVFAVYFE